MSPASLERAAAGVLPDWACVSRQRLAHIERVAALLTGWASVLAPEEVGLWRAAAWLHDALRDADPQLLRQEVSPEFQSWPAALLHGPATAFRLQQENPAAPRNLLDAVAYHTVGHARLDTLGRALYLADFLEPGRSFCPVWRATLRARMPAALVSVLKDVTASRVTHLLRTESPLRSETIEFWNSVVAD